MLCGREVARILYVGVLPQQRRRPRYLPLFLRIDVRHFLLHHPHECMQEAGMCALPLRLDLLQAQAVLGLQGSVLGHTHAPSVCGYTHVQNCEGKYHQHARCDELTHGPHIHLSDMPGVHDLMQLGPEGACLGAGTYQHPRAKVLILAILRSYDVHHITHLRSDTASAVAFISRTTPTVLIVATSAEGVVTSVTVVRIGSIVSHATLIVYIAADATVADAIAVGMVVTRASGLSSSCKLTKGLRLNTSMGLSMGIGRGLRVRTRARTRMRQ